MTNHRRAAKRAKATRAATAVGALAATASIALTSPGIATAAAPNYGQVTSDLSHALDNFLDGTNTGNNGIWNPIAGQTGGLLPIINSSYTKSDLTDLKNIAAFTAALRDIVNMDFPWTTTPGLIPNIVLPGGTTIDVQSLLPAAIPGAGIINDTTALIDGILNLGLGTLVPGLPAVPGLSGLTLGNVIGNLPLPALGDLIKGLEVTHSQFQSDFDMGPLAFGHTQIQNNFIQTPSRLVLDLTSIDVLNDPLVDLSGLLSGLGLGDLTGLTNTSIIDLLEAAQLDPANLDVTALLGDQELPSVTAWIPQGSGQYGLLGATAGWWAAAPTANIAVPAILGATDPFDLTISIPITSVGAALPFNLASVSNLNTMVLLPLDNGVYSPVSLNVTNMNTAFGFGVTNVNISSNNYIGTNGVNLNNGQNVLILQNPFLPIPIVYSLGGFNVGPNGAGIYMPSLFGISLLPNIQLGDKPTVNLGLPNGADAALNALGVGALLNNPLIPTSLINATSFIPGVNDLITQGEGFLTPFYLNTLGAMLNPISAWAGDQYGPVIDGTGNNILKLSEFYKDLMEKLSDTMPSTTSTPSTTSAPITPLAADAPTGSHSADPTNTSQTSVSALAGRLGSGPANDSTPADPIPNDTTPPAPVVAPAPDPAPVITAPADNPPAENPPADTTPADTTVTQPEDTTSNTGGSDVGNPIFDSVANDLDLAS